MVGQQALLLAGLFLPGFLLSDAAKILTSFALGECLAEESERGPSQAPVPELSHSLRSEDHSMWCSREG